LYVYVIAWVAVAVKFGINTTSGALGRGQILQGEAELNFLFPMQ